MTDPAHRHADGFRPCLIIPVYNAMPALVRVLDSALSQGLGVWVVDDGSTDGGSQLLATCADRIHLLRHSVNQGKGVALWYGLTEAFKAGYTHGITLDSDGQHDPADVPRFVETARQHPGDLVIGVRDLRGGGASLKSRLLRINSNCWSWLETGVRTGDSQSGYRVYPLSVICALALSTRRYDFEIDSLVKGVWSGLGVQTVPIQVRYDTGCRSHFRPMRDFLLVSHLNVKLLAAAFFLPLPVRQVICQRAFAERHRLSRWRWLIGELVFHAGDPVRFGVAVGVGVCCGILPVWGFQMLLAVVLAGLLRLNKVVVLAASNISFGFMVPLIVLLSTLVGRWVMMRSDSRLLPLPRTIEQAWQFGVDYLVGSIVLAVGGGLVLGCLGGLLMGGLRLCRRKVAC